MSKERARARAVREAAASRRAAELQQQRDREVRRRTRAERRDLVWRRNRLWQHGSAFRRRREAWAALATVALLAVVVTWVFTRSWQSIVFVVLVLVIGMPALAMLTLDRRRR